MIYKALYIIEPPSYFGLPEGDKTVVKADPERELVSAVLDTRRAVAMVYGSESEPSPQQGQSHVQRDWTGGDARRCTQTAGEPKETA